MIGCTGRLLAATYLICLLSCPKIGVVHLVGAFDSEQPCNAGEACDAPADAREVREDTQQLGSLAVSPSGAVPSNKPEPSPPDRPEVLAEPSKANAASPAVVADDGLVLSPSADISQELGGNNGTDGRSWTTQDPGFGGETSAAGEPGASGADGEVVPVVPVETSSEEDFDEDRHNFALAKDGAKVVATNKEARKAGALLDNDADTFLKNECKADKWVIIELSQVTKMDTLLISQNELYSSRIKEFEVRGRQSHPRAEGSDYAKSLNSTAWQLLGRFNASNAKGSQAFKLERPAWIKFLQLRMLSHYGTEAVCALNALCVFGKSAAEDLEARLHLTPEAEEGEPKGTEMKPEALVLEALPEAPPPVVVNNSSEPAGPPVKEAAADVPQQPSLKLDAESPPVASAIPAPLAREDGSNNSINITLPAEPGSADGSEGVRLPVEVLEPGVETTLPHPESSQVLPEAETVGQPGDEELPSNSAGSSANRHGGSLYDMIVQELKAIKLQQKAGARTLAQLQRNVTAVMGGFALELDRISARLRRIDPEPPALMSSPASTSLDFREQQCRASPANVTVVKPPSELELLQLEVAALKEMVQQSKRQADGMLLALAFSLLGGIGLSFAVGNTGREGRLPRILLCCTAVPPALAAAFWVAGGGLSIGKLLPPAA